MRSTPLADRGVAPRAGGVRRLFVAWQDPETRSITPVGCLIRRQASDGETFEFYYLRRARQLSRFRPFVGFPSLGESYQAASLFPFFENRIMPRTRGDYGDYVGSLGLPVDADPFEILARSEGRRATDTIEVFPEPSLEDGTVTCRFLVHGVRHIPGAQDVIDGLSIGETLCVLPDPQNDFDKLAVLLSTGDHRLVGYIPAYLTSLIHRPLDDYGPDAVQVNVEHIGDRGGPSHLRLLCRLVARWPDNVPPLGGPDFEPLGSEDVVIAKFVLTKDSAGKFVLMEEGSTGKYHFRVLDAKGQVIASSESYESKASALKGMESVKRNAPRTEDDNQTEG